MMIDDCEKKKLLIERCYVCTSFPQAISIEHTEEKIGARRGFTPYGAVEGLEGPSSVTFVGLDSKVVPCL